MIPTPHITAKIGDFADTVLMPGDPLRSKFIADNYLDKAVLVNNVRGIQGYTGFFEGKRISVMASGMGMPSIGIYAYELFNFYDVKNVIRVGSCGATHNSVKVRDLVIGDKAYTTSSFAENFGLEKDFIGEASPYLLNRANKVCESLNIIPKIGNVFSSDVFYGEAAKIPYFIKYNIIAVEMEGAALYMNAYKANKNALLICTASDSLVDKNAPNLTAEEREKSFASMFEVALRTAD
ncbi:MAG: Purine nucleoside phosphorylase DeoD-type 1 [Firmicutes bacterium ADurb.Bin080]|jgi:purine-nucleoside phosphorylase|nr:purine-nucleoside phosphorylase [Clostridiales bacterium]OQC16318.1 MAG: Purine nucleoside phosphorylase DeoD-type 1 [Firmicutes bacterium ADurb.Bin080]